MGNEERPDGDGEGEADGPLFEEVADLDDGRKGGEIAGDDLLVRGDAECGIDGDEYENGNGDGDAVDDDGGEKGAEVAPDEEGEPLEEGVKRGDGDRNNQADGEKIHGEGAAGEGAAGGAGERHAAQVSLPDVGSGEDGEEDQGGGAEEEEVVCGGGGHFGIAEICGGAIPGEDEGVGDDEEDSDGEEGGVEVEFPE